MTATPTLQPTAPYNIGAQSAPPTPAAAPTPKPNKETQTPPPSPMEKLFTIADVMKLLNLLDEAHNNNRELERQGYRNLENPLTKIICGSLHGRLSPL